MTIHPKAILQQPGQGSSYWVRQELAAKSYGL